MKARLSIAVLLLGLIVHAILFLWPNFLAQAIATLILTGLLPATLFVELLLNRQQATPTWLERILYTIATSYVVMVIVALLLSYLPGPLHRWHTLLAFDSLLLLLLILYWRRTSADAVDLQSSHDIYEKFSRHTADISSLADHGVYSFLSLAARSYAFRTWAMLNIMAMKRVLRCAQPQLSKAMKMFCLSTRRGRQRFCCLL